MIIRSLITLFIREEKTSQDHATPIDGQREELHFSDMLAWGKYQFSLQFSLLSY